MNKKAVLKIVMIFILMIIVVFSVFYTVFNEIIKSSVEESEEKLTCLQDVDLKIVDSCYEKKDFGVVRIIVKNNNNFNYDVQWFKLRASRKGRVFELATELETKDDYMLRGFEQKEFVSLVLDNPQEIEEFILIPKIKQEEGFCYGEAIKFEAIKECSNI